MTPHHHPSDATLLTYAAGSLGEGFSLAVASHLAFCSTCRAAVTDGEAIGGDMLAEVMPEAVAATTRDRVLARLGEAPVPGSPASPSIDPLVPSPLASYLDRPLAALPWRPLAPGLRQFELLPRDSRGGNLRLLRVGPGRSLLRHGHRGSELTLILSGSYADELGRFRRGDLVEVDGELMHQPLVDTAEECICLIATDAPLRFDSLLGRLAQRLTGI